MIGRMTNASASEVKLDSHELNDLTLIVPTYNRPEHLRRLLEYYASADLPLHILVLDSSRDEIRTANQALIANLGPYFRHVSYRGTIPVATKLMQGLGLVKTTYCSFCADDDLVFIDGLLQAKDFLSHNPDYVCVDGIYLIYWADDARVNVKIEYASTGINAEHPGARVFRLFQKYESLFYGVFRTADLAKIFIGVSRMSSLHFQELYQAASALLLGKSHRLPIFYAARQHCEPAEPERDKWQTYYWFAENREEFLQHYLDYREDLWSFYQSHARDHVLTHNDFKKAMDLAHAMFFSVGCPPQYFFSELQHLWPNDTFKSLASDSSVRDQLKSTDHIQRESRAEQLIERVRARVRQHYSEARIEDLNRETQLAVRMQRRLMLHDNLEWLASAPEFRAAYLQLCRYLSCNMQTSPQESMN